MSRWRDIKQNRNSSQNDISIKEESSIESSSISSRLRAFLTDTFLITTPIFYVVIYLIMGSGEAFAQDRTSGWLMILFVHASIILFFWLVKSQTPGLKAYTIKVVDNKTKQKISFIQALVRYTTTLIAVVSLFLMFLPFLRKDKKTFQDILSNTIIIDEK
ncbi:MAG: RDD family protein [Poseidonibacter sp.]|uniref:RDD family protein n=1 Tax=Poseidonibacter sp. TaxID=2321188 RepID=UPI00359E7167